MHPDSNYVDDVCLVLPSTNRHAKHLGDVVTSIRKQTLQPKEIIIAMSEADERVCQSWKQKISEMTDLNIQLDCVPQKANAAENRNRGAMKCKSNIISFMDCDDVMRDDRLQTIVSKMDEYSADALLHTYIMNDECSGGSGKTYKSDEMRSIHKSQNARQGPIHLELDPPPHHGHISVRKHVFSDLKQDESELYRRSEDAEYVRRLIDHGRDLIFVDECLSDYRIQNSSELL